MKCHRACVRAVTDAGHGVYGSRGTAGGIGGTSGGCGYYQGCVQKLANYERYIAAGLITFTDREIEHGCMSVYPLMK